jgi:CzcA family heavy metal efflux pump
VIGALVRFSVRRPGIVLALALTVTLYGLHRLYLASLDVFPEFSPTQVVIQTEAPGLNAHLTETLVTRPIESGIAGVAGLKSLRSQSIPGLSVVTVVFEEGSDIYRNRQMIAERLNTVALQLPTGIAPGITPLTSSASTVLGLGVTSDKRSLMELRTLVDWTLRPHLLGVSGVADVNVFGGEVKQWQVQADPARLNRYGLTLTDVLNAARRATGVRGAGYIENANQRIVLATEGQAGDPRELDRAPVTVRNGQVIALGDVARVVEAPAPSISAAAIDGKPGVFMMVQGQFGGNTRAVTLSLERALEDLKPLLEREQVTLHPKLFRPANFIETAVTNVQRDVLIGSVLVVSVLFLFLYNARTAFISAVAIPLSLLTAVLVLEYLHINLNIMVLGGLAIALGEVVDDAIIDSENIFRRLRENQMLVMPQPGAEVVYAASMEVRSSVVYATFIVALVFVPLLTLSGVAGKLFAPLALAYIFAILASLAVALTVTPALSYVMLARKALRTGDPPVIAWLKPRYERLLQRIEKRPRAVLAGVGLGLAAGMAILPLFNGEFIPPLKEGHYIVHMTAIPGTSEQESLRVGNRVTTAMSRIDGVKSVAQWVGRAQNGADTFGTHYSEFEVEIGPLPGAEQTRILRQIRQMMSGGAGGSQGEEDDTAYRGAGGFPGVTFAVNTFLTERIEETVAGYAAAVLVHVFGPDSDAIERDARSVARVLAGVPGATDVQLQAPLGTPELSIRLRPDKLGAWGLAPLDVLETVQAAYEGAPVAQVYRSGQVIGIAVTLAPGARREITEVAALPLRTPGGTALRLGDVADIGVTDGRYKILRANGKRVQAITCNVAGRDPETFMAEARSRIGEKVKLAPGNYLVFAGTGEAQAEARRDLIVHALIAGVGVALLLYMAFRSLRNLVITFVNLPFALIGGVVAVLLGGGWVSLGSMVGFVTLFGITLRNSVMLVSHYYRLVEEEGAPWTRETAIRGASERLPSILMTALVTALGLLPLALGTGQPGREIEGPMATIIVGGLVTSTLLNLLILPTILLHYGKFTPGGAAEPL